MSWLMKSMELFTACGIFMCISSTISEKFGDTFKNGQQLMRQNGDSNNPSCSEFPNQLDSDTGTCVIKRLQTLSQRLSHVSVCEQIPQAGCARFPLLQQLRAILAKPSMESFTSAVSSSASLSTRKSDSVSAPPAAPHDLTAIGVSHAIYESPDNEAMRKECPLGVATSEIYLAVAQEKDWKYKLLHKGLYALLNHSNQQQSGTENSQVANGATWPVNVELVDTLYRNTESSMKPTVKIGNNEGKSVLFYNWYLSNQCECTSRSWCHPFYLYERSSRDSVEIYLVGRDLGKTVYRMDNRGCFRSIGYGLSDVFIDHEFWKIFVFEINAFMHPEMRALKRKSEILFPMYTISDHQISAFGNSTTIISDHTYMKPPSPALTRTLTVEYRKSSGKPRQRRLVFPAAVWSPKQQVEFLKKIGNHLNQLDLSLVFLGECVGSGVGNLTYCHEFDRLVSKHSKRVQWLEAVSDSELGNFYATSLAIVLNSNNDCNPRVLYEALWTDTPFLVSSGVVLPDDIKKFGRVFTETDDLVDILELFLTEATSRRKWKTGELRRFAEDNVNEDRVYDEIFARAGIPFEDAGTGQRGSEL